YSKELVVIGVHSAKFENEKDSENIRRAIMRYEISHPVINDSEMTVWQKFGVHSWPTLVLIDPEGVYFGSVSGEGNREFLDAVIPGAIGKTNGPFDKASFDHPQGMALVGNQLYVADTENHLIRSVDLTSKTVHTLAGTGKQALDRRLGGDLLRTALNSPWD